MSATTAPAPEAHLDHIADVMSRAGLPVAVVSVPEMVTHVAVTVAGRLYRLTPVPVGISVWFVPEVGDPVLLGKPATPARAAGVVLDHRAGVLA